MQLPSRKRPCSALRTPTSKQQLGTPGWRQRSKISDQICPGNTLAIWSARWPANLRGYFGEPNAPDATTALIGTAVTRSDRAELTIRIGHPIPTTKPTQAMTIAAKLSNAHFTSSYFNRDRIFDMSVLSDPRRTLPSAIRAELVSFTVYNFLEFR